MSGEHLEVDPYPENERTNDAAPQRVSGKTALRGMLRRWANQLATQLTVGSVVLPLLVIVIPKVFPAPFDLAVSTCALG